MLGPPRYGQGSASERCGNWTVLFRNNSDTAIIRIVFDPPSGEYSNFADYNPETKNYPPPIHAHDPDPAILDVSLPAHGEQVQRFQTWTTTTPPASANYEFGATKPDSVSFTWDNGLTGVGTWVYE